MLQWILDNIFDVILCIFLAWEVKKATSRSKKYKKLEKILYLSFIIMGAAFAILTINDIAAYVLSIV